MSLHSWVSEHKLASIGCMPHGVLIGIAGAVWATGIGASFLANSRKTSAMKPSLRLIHARMHAQALTLAVLSGAAAYHYYEKRRLSDSEATKPQVETARADTRSLVEWDVLSPF